MSNLIESLEIGSFCGITNLKISDLGTFNIFVGKYNSGIGSVLDALRLVSDVGLHSKRIKPGDTLSENLSVMLYRFADENKKLADITVTGNNQEHSLLIEESKKIRRVVSSFYFLKNHFVTRNSEEGVQKVDYDFLVYPVEMLGVGINGDSENLSKYKPYNYEYVGRGCDFDLDTFRGLTSEQYCDLIQIMQAINYRIYDIYISGFNKPPLVVRMDGPHAFPLVSLDYEIRRSFAIALKLVTCKDSALLLDFIEDGFYFDTLGPLLNVINKVATRNNVQVFATAQSFDVLTGVRRSFTPQDSVRVINLVKLEDRHKAYPYHYEELDTLLAQGVEIR